MSGYVEVTKMSHLYVSTCYVEVSKMSISKCHMSGYVEVTKMSHL